MADRVYEVFEHVGVWSIGYVRARSKAEAIEKVHRGEVELMHGEATPLTKVNARLLRGDEAVYFDPGPSEPAARWADLFGAAPNYTGGVPVDEWLEAHRD